MASKTISGKDVKNARIKLGLTQPKFAKWLSKESGEAIDSVTVCRLENLGAKDACHPVQPSHAVITVIARLKEEENSSIMGRLNSVKEKENSAEDIEPGGLTPRETGDKAMSKKVEEYEHRYEAMKLMEQSGENLAEKMLNAYRSEELIPPELRDLSDEELMQKLGIEDTGEPVE